MFPSPKVIAVAIAVGLTTALSLAAAQVAQIQVVETAGQFRPAVITIHAGDAVSFFMTASCRLVIANADGTMMKPASTWSERHAVQTFATAGLRRARCVGQSKWQLTIMVRPQRG